MGRLLGVQVLAGSIPVTLTKLGRCEGCPEDARHPIFTAFLDPLPVAGLGRTGTSGVVPKEGYLLRMQDNGGFDSRTPD